MEDANLMFNALNDNLQEAITTLRDIKVVTETQPIMSDGKVLEPIIVFKEGSYKSVNRKNQPVDLVVDKDRLERWVSNTMRDVPFNIDHKREAGPNNYGWLRVSSGNSYVAQDPRDGKWALFAQPEFTNELFEQVKTGRFRDVSLEVDVTDDILVGIAVTNYPRLKTLSQFNDLEVPKVDIKFEENKMDELTKLKAELADMQAKFQKDADDKAKAEADRIAKLEAMLTAEKEARATLEREKEKATAAAKRAQLILGFSEKVDKLVLNEKGETVLAPGTREDVIELFAFLADHNEVALFSELDEEAQVNPIDLLERILTKQAKFHDIMRASPLNEQRLDVEDAANVDDSKIGDTLKQLFRQKQGK